MVKLREHDETAPLRTQLAQTSNDSRTDPTSRTNFKCLTKEELTLRARKLSCLKVQTDRKISILQSRLSETLKCVGISIDNDTQYDLSALIDIHDANVSSEHPSGSFARLFWEQQKSSSSKMSDRDEMAPTHDKVGSLSAL